MRRLTMLLVAEPSIYDARRPLLALGAMVLFLFGPAVAVFVVLTIREPREEP